MIQATKKITNSYAIGLESKEEQGMVYQTTSWEYILPYGFYFTKSKVNDTSIEIVGDEVIGYATKPIAFFIECDIFDSIEKAIEWLGHNQFHVKPLFTQDEVDEHDNCYEE